MRLLALALLFVALVSAQSPMFRGSSDHLGVSSSAVAPGLNNVKWKFKTGGKVVSTPAIDAGTAYFGSSDHYLYAVRTSDGSLRWRFKTDGAVNSSPAVSEGLVFAGSLDGTFYAIDADTGTLKWKFATGGEKRFTAAGLHGMQPSTETMPDPFDVFLSSPAVAGGTVYFGSGDNNVYALEAKSGALKWKFATGDVVHASPAISEGALYIGSWDRNLYALNASSGALLWKFQTGDDSKAHNQIGIASSAAVAAGLVVFGCRDGHFYAVDARTGEKKWAEDNKMGWVIASPAVQSGVVYFPTSDGTRFKALNAANGALLYGVVNKAISFSSPAVVGDKVYFGTSDGWLHAIDGKTGAVIAEFQTEGNKQNASKYIDSDGKMMTAAIYPDATLDGIIVGLDRMYSLGSILSSPVVVDGVVYFGSTDGYLYAVS